MGFDQLHCPLLIAMPCLDPSTLVQEPAQAVLLFPFFSLECIQVEG